MTISAALAEASALDRLDAQLLLLHVLGRPATDRAWLLAHDDQALTAQQLADFQALCTRRAAGEPLAYLVGEKEFFGLMLAVDARVLVPRPDTETLVEWALALLAARPQPRVIDLGTGSGAIALAVKAHCPAAEVTATDLSADALAVARTNAERHQLDLRFAQGAWLDAAEGAYDLILSNPPYIPAGDPHLPGLRHEPEGALVAGSDGLDDIRRIVAGALHHLRPGGWLLLEHGWDQAEAVRALLTRAGLADAQSRTDLAGIARCSGARRLELG